MSKALIQTTNQTDQNVALNGIIGLGSVLRRFGCNCKLSGNAIEIQGDGYYTIDASVSVSPTAAGAVTVALYENGVQIPGAIGYSYAGTAAIPIAIPIITTVRKGCCCDGASNITAVLVEGEGVVNNISVRVEKI